MLMTTSAVHTPRTVEKVCTIRWEKSGKDIQIPRRCYRQNTEQAGRES